MKFENFKISQTLIDIDIALQLSKVNKDELIKYLEKRSEERFLIFKSYEDEKESIASKEIEELRTKVDFMISKIKKGDRELKIKSLEERFLNQKKLILSSLETTLEGYKNTIQVLNEKLLKIDKNEAYIGYPFINNEIEREIAFAFPIKVEWEYGNVYIRHDLGKEVISNKKIFGSIKTQDIKLSLKKLEKETIKKIAILNIETKTKSEVEIILENKNLTDRMKRIINGNEYRRQNKFAIEISILKTNSKEIMQIVTQKDDFILCGGKYKEKLLEIVENLLVSGERILFISEESMKINKKLNEFILEVENDEEVKALKNNELLERLKILNLTIKNIINIEKVMNINTTFGLDVKVMCDKLKNHELYSDEAYLRYKKSLNLDDITYNELKNNIEDITVEDIEKYKTYKIFKDKFITFNEYPYSYDELLRIKNIIQKIKETAEEKDSLNRKYFKKITFKIKNKGTKLELEDLREVGREIAREKNRELLIEDKASWSIKNIFNANKQKEKRREELELFKEKEIQEIKQVIEFYKELDSNYRTLEEIDKNVFEDIISILCKDNYKEEISKKIKNIEFSLKNKDILSCINSWNNFKMALVDYLYKSKNLSESKNNLIFFKISEELLKISQDYGINILKEYKNYENSDFIALVQEQEKLFKECIKRKCVDENKFNVCSFRDVENLELKQEEYDTVILLDCDTQKEEIILPLFYRAKRCLCFRDKTYETRYEKNFIRLK